MRTASFAWSVPRLMRFAVLTTSYERQRSPGTIGVGMDEKQHQDQRHPSSILPCFAREEAKVRSP